MIGVWSERFARIEYALVCVFALVLPIMEAPKNLAVLLLLLTWVVHRIVARDVTLRRPDWVEASLLLMLGASIASTAVNWPLVNGLKGLQHTVMQVLVFWLIYRAAHSERQQLRLIEMVVAGVMIGLVWGIVEYAQGRHEHLRLHSVGGVIESAAYLGIALATTFSIAWARTIEVSAARVVRPATLWWAATAIMLVGLFLMGNRGAILAVFVAGVVYALAIGRRSFWLGIVGGMALVALLTTMLPDWFSHKAWLAKTREMTTTGQLTLAMSDRERIDHWRVGVARIAQGDTLVLGIGPHNSVTIDYSKMEFDPPLLPISERLLHMHNMFLTKLVEEGIVGLAAMLFFFSIVTVRLVRDRRRGEWRHWRWFAAVGALTTSIIAGQVGPRWHQEHALLVMIVLAIYFAPRPTSPALAHPRRPS